MEKARINSLFAHRLLSKVTMAKILHRFVYEGSPCVEGHMRIFFITIHDAKMQHMGFTWHP